MNAEHLTVDKLLDQINSIVDKQVSGIELRNTAPVEECLANVQSDVNLGPAVAEFTSRRYRRLSLSRASVRVFFPDIETGFAPPALEAFRTLRTRLLRKQAKKGFRAMVVSSSVPEEGKTLTTWNLSLCFAHLPDFPVLVVDGDLRTRGLTRLAGNPPAPGLAEVLSGSVSREAAVIESDVPNLYVLGAGHASTPPPQLFTGARWSEFIAWAKGNFKLVLVDSPPVLPLADYDLIASPCEALMLVIRARVTQRAALEKVLGHIDHSKLVGVSFNAVSAGENGSYGYYYYGRPEDSLRSEERSQRHKSRWFGLGGSPRR